IVDPQEIGVVPTTRGILAFPDEFRKLEYSCIGCGKCTDVCPSGLSPYYIYQVLNSKNKRNLQLFDAQLCIGCGLCSYICPAKLDLQQAIARAASLTRQKEAVK
ncbi:MAG: 4Fe-4S dicluster domain-containing protein, partial [Oscillospiraceae bacterium]